MTITITGASDDLIEIDGDISEEFGYRTNANTSSGDIIACSDGTLLRIEFTRTGIWRITPITKGAGFISIEQAPEGDEDNRTDKAQVDALWVAHSIDYAKR